MGLERPAFKLTTIIVERGSARKLVVEYLTTVEISQLTKRRAVLFPPIPEASCLTRAGIIWRVIDRGGAR